MFRQLWLIFAQACTVALAALLVLQTFRPQWLPPWHPGARGMEIPAVRAPASAPAAQPTAESPASSLAQAAARAAPTVVSIGTAAPSPGRPWSFGTPQREQRGVGSGVIIESGEHEGLVLTNHHVIAQAQRIEVQLSDGRSAMAERVGADPETDLALLRVPLGRMPTIEAGASRSLRVGDTVLAIGNPFGVGQTVTAGIVSALQRQQLGINVFESFIQTDAAINPGNSGGALVDAQGRLVGINSAIYSRNGGSVGLGFAIPIELAQEVMNALRRDGQVARGWMGVSSRELSAELIEALRLPVDIRGVLISAVQRGTPAEKAGIRPGDVLLRVGESAVDSPEALLNAVARLKPGTEVTLTVQRQAEQKELRARVGQRPVPRS